MARVKAYEVERLEGTRPCLRYTFDAQKRIMVGETVERDAGFMVYFPQGHSIHVWTEAELEAYGLSADPNQIPMSDADDAAAEGPSPKETVARKTKQRRTTLDDADLGLTE